jgi:hypothetical protein
MYRKYLFEWMDTEILPRHIRDMLIEILEYSLGNLRNYYEKCGEKITEELLKSNYKSVYEMGAGNAKLSQLLSLKTSDTIKLIPCDLNPKIEHFRNLEKKSKGKITPIYESLNINDFGIQASDSIMVFSASFHHISKCEQIILLKNLKNKTGKIMIFEPLRKNILNILSTFSLLLPIFAFPLFKPKFSHFFWCWIIPIAGPLFVWDGIVTCLRQNTTNEWKWIFSQAGITEYKINSSPFSQEVSINCNGFK